jgi:hypothetical protein
MKREIGNILESLKEDDDYNVGYTQTSADQKLLSEIESLAKDLSKKVSAIKKSGNVSPSLRYILGDCKRHIKDDINFITDSLMDMK